MSKSSYAAIAAAIAFSSSARAHEFVCEKTVNGDVVHEIKSYPEKLTFKVSVINTHPTDASTALSVRDALMSSLGVTFAPAPPFTVAVGQSADFSFDVTVHDEAECLKLAQAQACGASFEDLFEVTFDGGSAQCAARLICGHVSSPPPPPPPASCKYDADCGPGRECKNGMCEDRHDDHMCKYDADCGSGRQCKEGKCEDRDDGHMCRYDADCGSGRQCKDNKCEDRDDGHMCRYDGDCGSEGRCKDGKCTDRGDGHDDGGDDGDHGGGDDHHHRSDDGGKGEDR